MDGEIGPRDHLIAVARRMVDEGDPGTVTLRAIARAAGVSHGAPLRHFSGRASLLSAVAALGFGDLAARGERALGALPAEAGAVERLRAAASAYVGFALEQPGMFALMFRHDLVDPQEPELAGASLTVFDTLAALVGACQAEGWNPAADIRQVTGALWAALHGLAQLWIWSALPTATGARSSDEVLEVLLGMLGLPESRGRR
ncbi:TetR/AcrR family transcriptional regulator [Microbispora hainanensis]|uniref:TetR/AcrR family transcriptional regulator n=1 Tax=Microbispora hainanensis TaxID=568844 RepID=UPI002E27D86F|nr:TetR/AcrR family transcriptional regulator [Microbispora hainanensis]